MGNIKVKSTLEAKKDGGHTVVIWEKDERHPGGEIYIADDKVHTVAPTAGVHRAISEKRLVEVSGKADTAKADDPKADDPKGATTENKKDR